MPARTSRPPQKSEIERLEARIRAFAASPELVNENIGLYNSGVLQPSRSYAITQREAVTAIAINSILRYLNLPEK